MKKTKTGNWKNENGNGEKWKNEDRKLEKNENGNGENEKNEDRKLEKNENGNGEKRKLEKNKIIIYGNVAKDLKIDKNEKNIYNYFSGTVYLYIRTEC